MQRKYPSIFRSGLETYIDQFHSSVTDFENYLFYELPGVNSPQWTPKMEKAKKLFQETMNADSRNWICLPIFGTTTSGDPAGTTLVNTLHSLMFDWLYVIEACGIMEPWKR